jgi:5-formyltetrahydrofolate cyclo-ligase
MKGQEDLRKRHLRRELLARRAALSGEDIAGRSRIIAYRVIQSWEFQQARAVLLYAHFDHEVQTHELMAAAACHRKRVILPRVNRSGRGLDLFFVEDPQTQLAPGTWRIPEPVPELCEPAGLDDVECVIAPGVGFDLSGGRLGYGGGYYDRLLNALTPAQARVAVGICFETQIVREVPRGFFDAAVSVVCTEVNLFDHR